MISIHAPRMGSDYPITITPLGISAFQSTLPGWGATRRHNHGGQTRGDFNPRSPDGERHGAGRTARDTGIISIHAPRMGSDERCPCRTRHPATFQSTLPGWGATRHRKTQAALAKISIHAPRMGSDAHHRVAIVGQEVISIHAPRMGSDLRKCGGSSTTMRFQSTLPGWGATWHWLAVDVQWLISIHAPRMGSDVPDLGDMTKVD
ncbi:hypothetical protein B5783_1427 [Bifidobacterium breve]|nr:hypothetical protein B5783_1427 [Bifidobacterium breve]